METIQAGPLPADLRACGGADAFLRTCASRAVLDLIANKWVCLVVVALHQRHMRFGELRRRLDGVTQKMLTQTLRDLERAGLVHRSVYPSVPPRVEYSLTDLGVSASGLLDAIRTWAQDHMAEIELARTAYDARAAEDLLPV
jgi:DNA-binding HxlR family transcriptional regulator